MKIAFLSDIHANYVALKECLNYIKNNNFDGVVFLGDYITDCPYPQKTLDLLKDAKSHFKTWFIRGNREDYMIKHHEGKEEQNWKYSSAYGCLLYTYENLNAQDIETFKAMPISDTISIEGCKPFTICHGSPSKTKELLLPYRDNSKEALKRINTDYLFCGHTHTFGTFGHKGKKMIACGSVGLSVNFDTKAQFVEAEFIDNDWKTKLISLDYDKNKILKAFDESGIYSKGYHWAHAVAKCIKTGVNYPVLCLNNALEFAKKGEETLSEVHWSKAAQALKLNSNDEERIHLGMPTLFAVPDIEESARLCNVLNLRFIELHMSFPWFQPKTININHLQYLTDYYGIYFTLHLPDINPCDFNDELSEAYTKVALDTIEIAKKLKVPIINMHMPKSDTISLPDGKVFMFDIYKDRYIKKIIDFKEKCIKQLGDSKIKICIENTTGYKNFDKAALDILLDSDVFYLCLDTGHAECAKSDCVEYITHTKANKLAHFHLQDSANGKSHLTLGEGNVDYEKFYRLASKIGDCRVVIEVKSPEGLKTSVDRLNKIKL